jgi:hypothetical protein
MAEDKTLPVPAQLASVACMAWLAAVSIYFHGCLFLGGGRGWGCTLMPWLVRLLSVVLAWFAARGIPAWIVGGRRGAMFMLPLRSLMSHSRSHALHARTAILVQEELCVTRFYVFAYIA